MKARMKAHAVFGVLSLIFMILCILCGCMKGGKKKTEKLDILED